jgi:hypothetical protein
LDAFYFSVTTLTTIALGTPDEPVTAPDPLDAILKTVAGIVLLSIVGAAVGAAVLAVLYLIRWRLNRLRTVLVANWLRTAWIALGVFVFVMVVVPGALLIYQYSGIGD